MNPWTPGTSGGLPSRPSRSTPRREHPMARSSQAAVLGAAAGWTDFVSAMSRTHFGVT